LALYHPGHITAALEKYKRDDFSNPFIHITNGNLIKKHPDFENLKEDVCIRFEE